MDRRHKCGVHTHVITSVVYTPMEVQVWCACGVHTSNPRWSPPWGEAAIETGQHRDEVMEATHLPEDCFLEGV